MRGESKLTFRFASILTVFVLTLSAGPALGESVDDLKAVEGKQAEARKMVEQADANKNKVNQEIKQADSRLTATENQLRALASETNEVRRSKAVVTAKLNQLRAELAQTQSRLDAAIKRLKKLTLTLNKRAGSFYKYGEISFLEVLLDSNDFSDFVTRARRLQTIISTDADLVKDIKKTRREIEKARAAIEQNRKQTQEQEDALTAEIRRLDVLAASEHAKRNEVKQQIDEKQQLVAKIEDDREAWLKAEAEFSSSAARIRAILAQSSAQPVIGSPSASGFIWPAPGGVSSPFGQRWGRLHAGVDIPVGHGTPVVASKSGRVAIASWYGGYGNLVVIDHGGGVSTWYGHNSALTVSAGQSVSRGQVIAKAGSTGHSTGPHVHFEIRFNGNPVNPMTYLP